MATVKDQYVAPPHSDQTHPNGPTLQCLPRQYDRQLSAQTGTAAPIQSRHHTSTAQHPPNRSHQGSSPTQKHPRRRLCRNTPGPVRWSRIAQRSRSRLLLQGGRACSVRWRCVSDISVWVRRWVQGRSRSRAESETAHLRTLPSFTSPPLPPVHVHSPVFLKPPHADSIAYLKPRASLHLTPQLGDQPDALVAEPHGRVPETRDLC